MSLFPTLDEEREGVSRRMWNAGRNSFPRLTAPPSRRLQKTGESPWFVSPMSPPAVCIQQVKTGAKFGDVFVKMTGPEQLVKEETPAFDSMVEKACRNADTGK